MNMKHLFSFLFIVVLSGTGCLSSTTTESETMDTESAEADTTEAQTDSISVTQPKTPAILPGIIDVHAHIYSVDEDDNDAYIAALAKSAAEQGVTHILIGLNARPEPDRPAGQRVRGARR